MADRFTLIVNTPDREFYCGDVTMLELTTSEGDIGIYAGHIPLSIKKAAVHGGIIEILQSQVNVLAEVAEWPEEIDVNRANEARIRAERRLKGSDADVNIVRAEMALKRSLARINAVD